ncbi:hypothetical protein [Thiospirillum jenense]|uniref:Uncharacterized protein n=1 Tax=Thiospirillum jenense TaxID=1653858 RepID=A0A839HIH2_9GAMM|nr:hypothetical protein [Thiospirillum jenense]MBB1125882.1 hypothetical protein [Thiospirillum jenense]
MNKHAGLFLASAASIVLLPPIAQAASPVDMVLSKFYDSYDTQKSCWRARVDMSEDICCLNIKRQDQLKTPQETRLYLLLTGSCIAIINGEVQDYNSHSSTGMVGAFILDLDNEKASIIAASPKLDMGSWGHPPADWLWIKLGRNHYWGWVTKEGYTGQGVTVSNYSILAPHGEKISLLNIPADMNDAGSCDEETACLITDVTSHLETDSAQIDQPVFPLLLTLKGKIKGQPVSPKPWVFLFDPHTWSYTTPAGFPPELSSE